MDKTHFPSGNIRPFTTFQHTYGCNKTSKECVMLENCLELTKQVNIQDFRVDSYTRCGPIYFIDAVLP